VSTASSPPGRPVHETAWSGCSAAITEPRRHSQKALAARMRSGTRITVPVFRKTCHSGMQILPIYS
jgi:hypothetical protein